MGTVIKELKEASGCFFVEFRSIVHGYHVYKGIWTAARVLVYARARRKSNYTADHLFIKRRLNIIQIAFWRYN